MQIEAEHFTGKGGPALLARFLSDGFSLQFVDRGLLSNILTVKWNRLQGFAGNCRGQRILIEKVVNAAFTS